MSKSFKQLMRETEFKDIKLEEFNLINSDAPKNVDLNNVEDFSVIIRKEESLPQINIVEGEKGADGAVGPAGPKGEEGKIGPAGIPGPPGVRGPKGEKGEKGDTGERGEKGEVGVTGEKGEQGPIGATGFAGPQGKHGVRGLQGPEGPEGKIGPQGEVGPDGLRGLTGPQGETGAVGPQGEKGEIGLPGIPGETGRRGPVGLQGFPGEPGKVGKRGTKGLKGDTGPKGDTGKVGASGAPGPAGAVGPAGKDGKDGTYPEHQVQTNGVRWKNPDGNWGEWMYIKNAGGGDPILAGGSGIGQAEAAGIAQHLIEEALAGFTPTTPGDGLIVEEEQEVIQNGTTVLDTPQNLKIGSQEIYLNGIRLSAGNNRDYSIDETNISFLNGWELFNQDIINILYSKNI